MRNAGFHFNASEADPKVQRAAAGAPKTGRTSLREKQRGRATGERPKRNRNRHAILPPVIGGVLILLSLAAGVFVTQYTDRPEATPEPTSKVIVVPARTPGPVNTPTVSALHLYAAGGELGADGFTCYVGDRPLKLNLEIEPKLIHPPVYWSLSDPEAASLSIGDNGLSCSFNPVKPSGKIELTVKCYGAELVIPVYLWNK